MSQMQQHSTMLAVIAKTVQVNSEELKECNMKVKNLEKQMEIHRKDNDDLKGHILGQERYKRRWCLFMKGKKEKVKQDIRAEVVKLLCKITLAEKMGSVVNTAHRVGRVTEIRHWQIIILIMAVSKGLGLTLNLNWTHIVERLCLWDFSWVSIPPP